MSQNKEIYEAIYEIKASQDEFRKEINEKINNISERVDQLITPDDSYWKVIRMLLNIKVYYLTRLNYLFYYRT